MKVGIGLATATPGVQRADVLSWARRADAAGFSTLGSLDRLLYPNWDPLVALSAATARAHRADDIGAPPPLHRSTALLGKQAATPHVLSEQRLTLGVGLGSRDDD